jgi:hypothetical protein
MEIRVAEVRAAEIGQYRQVLVPPKVLCLHAFLNTCKGSESAMQDTISRRCRLIRNSSFHAQEHYGKRATESARRGLTPFANRLRYQMGACITGECARQAKKLAGGGVNEQTHSERWLRRINDIFWPQKHHDARDSCSGIFVVFVAGRD